MATSSTPLVGGVDGDARGSGALFFDRDPRSPREPKAADEAAAPSCAAWAGDSLSKTLSSRYMRASVVYVIYASLIMYINLSIYPAASAVYSGAACISRPPSLQTLSNNARFSSRRSSSPADDYYYSSTDDGSSCVGASSERAAAAAAAAR